MSQKIYEFAVIHTPPQTKEDREAGRKPKSKLIVDVQRVLADDEKQAAMLAARSIPGEYEDKLSEVEIALRAF